ncbi:SRPBCC family protein [Williamsia sp. CHRR-6]|uniref:SRPBCC family protein n=1 Tax=Williamsia sp. CHRR-6 TaxID=2835871 RepID=UPI001BD9B2B7|nr:SRPBCC family protein [Williamsia sp. CHRR-6]MBT0566936.1 SRPBCC family protein [Williamsia sp. CHRR-6]
MSKVVEFSATRLIPVPLEVLWTITGSPVRNAEWVNNVRSVDFRAGPAEVGDHFTELSVVIGPWTSTTEWTVASVEPNRERVFVGGGFPGVGLVQAYTRFEPLTDSDGREHTKTTYGSQLTLQVGPLSRLYGAALRSMVTTEFATSLAELEKLAVREHRLSASA